METFVRWLGYYTSNFMKFTKTKKKRSEYKSQQVQILLIADCIENIKAHRFTFQKLQQNYKIVCKVNEKINKY